MPDAFDTHSRPHNGHVSAQNFGRYARGHPPPREVQDTLPPPMLPTSESLSPAAPLQGGNVGRITSHTVRTSDPTYPWACGPECCPWQTARLGGINGHRRVGGGGRYAGVKWETKLNGRRESGRVKTSSRHWISGRQGARETQTEGGAYPERRRSGGSNFFPSASQPGSREAVPQCLQFRGF